MKRFTLITFIIILLSASFSFAQNESIEKTLQVAKEYTMSNPDTVIQILSPFEKSIKKGKYPDKIKSEFYHIIGDAYYYKNNLRKSIKYYNKELSITEKNLSDKELVRIYYNLGAILYKQKKYMKVLNYFDKSLSYAKKLNDPQFLMQVYNALAKTYEHLGMFKKSLLYTKKYMKTKEKYYNLPQNGDFKGNDELTLLKEKLKKVIIEKKEKEKALKQTTEKLTKTVEEKKNLEEEALLKNEQIKRLKIQQRLQEKELELKEAEAKRKEAEIREQKRKIFFITIIVIGFVIFSIFITFLLIKLKRTNTIISRNNRLIKEQHKKIRDSISYAKRIQEALLPKQEEINKVFPENFILFKPRDIVSGDFYWITQKEKYTYFLVADCTGHGVPGAFMSMLGIAFLTNIIKSSTEILKPSEVLEQLRSLIKKSLSGRDDGMDMALIRINFEKKKLLFSGANNPAHIVNKGKLTTLKATRAPIGNYKKDLPFKDVEYELENGTTIYLFSDGYQDQFGGEKGEKFMKKRFKNLLVDVSEKNMKIQKEILEETLKNWMKGYKQLDDITVVGLRIRYTT